jgi:hypothetical protein
MFHFRRKSASLLSVAVLLAACGGGGEGGTGSGGNVQPPGNNPLPPGSAVIGAAGGTVTSDDGKVKLVIPAGALGNDQTITIESVDASKIPSDLTGADSVYDMKPDGLRFMQPVQATVVLPSAAQRPDGTLSAAAGALVSMSGADIEALGDQTIVVSGVDNRVTARGTLMHFSKLAFSSRLATSSGIQVGNPGLLHVRVRPLPKLMIVGKTERATFETAMEGFSDAEFFGGAFHYRDDSAKPGLQHIPEPGLQFNDGFGFLGRYLPPPLPRWQPLDRYGDYVCTLPGPVRYDVPIKINDLNLVLKFVNRLIPLQEVRYEFENDQSCVTVAPPAPPAPPPPPPPPAPAPAQVLPVDLPDLEGAVAFAAIGSAAIGVRFDEQAIADRWGVPVERVRSLVVAAINNGVAMIDVRNGEVVRHKDMQMPIYGAMPLFRSDLGCLGGFGLSSGLSCFDRATNDYPFTEIGVGRGPFSDAGTLGTVSTPTGLTTLKWSVERGRVRYDRQASTGEIEERQLLTPIGASRGWFVGGVLTGTAKSAAFNADLSRAIVATGGPGLSVQIWHGNPDDPSGGMLAGTIDAGGPDAAQIRCAMQVCALGTFEGRLVTFHWDGSNPPDKLAQVAGVTGAIGIDVAVEGAYRAIRSADYNNNTVTKTLLDANGDLVQSQTRPLPGGCTKPVQALSWPRPDGLFNTVVTCSGVDARGRTALAVLDQQFFDF